MTIFGGGQDWYSVIGAGSAFGVAMLIAGIIIFQTACLIIILGSVKMKNAKNKSDKTNETVSYLDT